jgi:hypothetical protein
LWPLGVALVPALKLADFRVFVVAVVGLAIVPLLSASSFQILVSTVALALAHNRALAVAAATALWGLMLQGLLVGLVARGRVLFRLGQRLQVRVWLVCIVAAVAVREVARAALVALVVEVRVLVAAGLLVLPVRQILVAVAVVAVLVLVGRAVRG